MGLFSTIGKVVGAVGGFAVGGPQGAAIGSKIGGAAGGLADGSKSSKQNKNAISSAEQAQVDAYNRAIGLQEQRYGDATRNLMPSVNSGNAALDQINALLGISGKGLYGTAAPGVSTTPWAEGYDNGAYERISANAPQGVDWASYVRANPDAMAQWSNQTPDLASFGGDINKYGAFHYVNDGSRRDISPFTVTPGQQPTMAGADGTFDRQQGAIDKLKMSPLYQSLFGNGRDAILSAGSATGGLRGGNINDALFKNGRDTLAQVIQQQLANLGGIQSQGQQAGLGLAGIGANSAGAIGNQITNIGNAQAGGILGRQQVANANSSSIDNILGSLFSSVGGAGGIGSLFKGGGSGGTTSADDFLESILGGDDF